MPLFYIIIIFCAIIVAIDATCNTILKRIKYKLPLKSELPPYNIYLFIKYLLEIRRKDSENTNS